MDQVSVTVASPPARVWSLVTDIARMGEWSPEATGGRWTDGTGGTDGSGPATGARFTGTNRHGPVRWSTHCRVTECVPPERFTFVVRENRMAWGWVLAPDAAGTRVTHWREHLAPPPWPVRLLTASGLLGRDREPMMVDGMRRTLDAVRATAERDA